MILVVMYVGRRCMSCYGNTTNLVKHLSITVTEHDLLAVFVVLVPLGGFFKYKC